MDQPFLSEMTRRNFLTASSAMALGSVTGLPMAREQNIPAGLATSNRGMVTSPHELATQAGQKVLRDGGNAIEAAIAIAACLNVTYPHFTGCGGDAFMIISDRNGKVRTLSLRSLMIMNASPPQPVKCG